MVNFKVNEVMMRLHSSFIVYKKIVNRGAYFFWESRVGSVTGKGGQRVLEL